MHVVSILDVPIRFGSTSFQSNDVRGAQKSEFLFWNKFSYKIRPSEAQKFSKWYFWIFKFSGVWFCVIIGWVIPDVSHKLRFFKMSGSIHPKAQHHIPNYFNFKDKIRSTVCLWKSRSTTHLLHVSHIIYLSRRLKKVFIANAIRKSNVMSALQVQRSVRHHIASDLILSSSLSPQLRIPQCADLQCLAQSYLNMKFWASDKTDSSCNWHLHSVISAKHRI